MLICSITSTPMSRGHRLRGGTNRHFIHVGPLGDRSFFSSLLCSGLSVIDPLP